MSIVSPSADFIYGNTRLRARKSGLLDAGEYAGLIGPASSGISRRLPAQPTAPSSKPYSLSQL